MVGANEEVVATDIPGSIPPPLAVTLRWYVGIGSGHKVGCGYRFVGYVANDASRLVLSIGGADGGGRHEASTLHQSAWVRRAATSDIGR